MDSFHLFLGHPWNWKDDVNSQHDGKINVSTITKYGMNYTMNPLPNNARDKQQESRILLVGENEMLQVLREEKVGFSLVAKTKE